VPLSTPMLTHAPMHTLLATLLGIASAWDIAVHRVPNALVVGIAATGVVAQALAGAGAVQIGGSVLAIAIVGAAVWPAWTRRWIGGGDLKLAAATAAWVGLPSVPMYLLASAAAVGGVSVLCYARSARSARSEIRRNLALAARGVPIEAPLGAEHGRVQVPAGVGFAIGAAVTLMTTGGL
jgi:prepilin peptidase CpaA